MPALLQVPQNQRPKFQVITQSTSGDATLVTAVTGKKIRVLAYNFSCSGTVNVSFKTGSTVIGGLFYGTVGLQKVVPFNPAGWFETTLGVGLTINLSANIAIGGELVYEEVTALT